MKDKERKIDETKITGFFDDGTEFNGELKFKGSFRIDGYFQGPDRFRVPSDHRRAGQGRSRRQRRPLSSSTANSGARSRPPRRSRSTTAAASSGRSRRPSWSSKKAPIFEANCQTLESKSTEDEIKSIIEQ